MSTALVHIGFGNYLSIGRIMAIAVPGSAPAKRSVQESSDKGLVIDLTHGRRTKAVVFTDSQFIVLAGVEPGTINGRLEDSV